ncbi:BolA/IbaG family iron-sulfur metabolism protein [Buchnera aphidicola]|uniref:Acid stress protein IbaG n=1 Tax=Buchnera aphidicola (Cinara strobi) TaxID=1921549 RepID=A0A3B1E7X3_9GAMM|nr:BolA/IbaG family iron-sulfur metabolism protein [Buchnera aphidicola]VAX76637.1 Acid stress protein IbaG [Buchnera aphidicola (Cinara strobi)]
MNIEKIKKLIKKKFNLNKVLIIKNEKNIIISAIGDFFLGMNSFERQKNIYKILLPFFLKKTIHAIKIHAYTQKEWKNKKVTLI